MINKDYFAHETACIEDDCTIGEGTKIWHFSHIMKGSVIGDRKSTRLNSSHIH